MFGWSDRPTKVEITNFTGGDEPAGIFTVGQYEVRVPGLTPENAPTVSYCAPYRCGSTDPRNAFPNLEVRDGEMRIPLEDIVGAILARVEPTEVAVALWCDDDVRAQFVEAMTTRWSGMNIGDADRRAFLHGVKEAIHSAAVDALASRMASLEHEATKRWSIHRQVEAVNETLANYGATRPARGDETEPQPLRIRDTMHDPEFRISGPAWNEARDFWRREVARQFPMPLPESDAMRDDAE